MVVLPCLDTVVDDEGKLVGVFSEKDLMTALIDAGVDRDAAYRLEAGVVDARSDLDEGDALGATEGLLEAAQALLEALPEPVATSD